MNYQNQISPQINGLRTLMMLIINFLVVNLGVKNLYELFNLFCEGRYTNWFYCYCWSGQYVSSKLGQ